MGICQSRLEVRSVLGTRIYPCEKGDGHLERAAEPGAPDAFHQAHAVMAGLELAHAYESVPIPDNPTASVDLGAGERRHQADVVLMWRPLDDGQPGDIT